jgi:hypothetical protein
VTADDEPARLAAATDVDTAGRTLHVIFRSAAEPPLAGGPAYLEAEVSLLAGPAIRLISSSARATGRSREYSFAARGPDGRSLRDPFADAVEIGGVQTSTPLTAERPVLQQVLLNQFLTLESVRDAVPDGHTAELEVRCVRQLGLEGQPNDNVPTAAVVLHLRMPRNDDELADRYRRAAETITSTPQFTVGREQLLTELCTARNRLAIDALTALVSHPDTSVAARARHALSALPGT